MIADDQPYTFLYVGLATRVLDKKIVLVERAADGRARYEKIYPTKSGSIAFYFNKWRKLEFTARLLGRKRVNVSSTRHEMLDTFTLLTHVGFSVARHSPAPGSAGRYFDDRLLDRPSRAR